MTRAQSFPQLTLTACTLLIALTAACGGSPDPAAAPEVSPSTAALALAAAAPSTSGSALVASGSPATGSGSAGAALTRAAAVKAPVFVRRIDPGQTGWFSSPALVDLTGDKKLEIVAPFYSTYVYSAAGKRLATGTATQGRSYAPSVVADLDRDGMREIVVGDGRRRRHADAVAVGGLLRQALVTDLRALR